MSDISTTFEFVFSADDQSTPAVQRAQAAVDSAVSSLENTLASFSDTTESIVGSLGGAVSEATDEVVMLGAATDSLVNSLTDMSSTPLLSGALDEGMGIAELIAHAESLMALIRAEEFDEMSSAFEDLAAGLGDMAENFIDNDLAGALTDMLEAIDAIPDEATPATAAVVDFGEAVAGQDHSLVSYIATALGYIAQFGGALHGVGTQMRGSGGMFGNIGGAMLQGFGNLFGGQGLMGFLLGPIGPILSLLSPLISLISDTLMPIFEDFIAIIQNAFAPLQFVLDTLLQSLIPHIQKALGPVVAMLTYMAVELGTQLQAAFAGVTSLIGPIMQAVLGLMPVLGKLFESIVMVATKALPVFVSLLNQVIPVAVKLFEILAEAFVARMDVIAQMVEELGPEFVTLIGELLQGLLPLVSAFVELGSVLLSEVFAPVGIEFLRFLITGLRVLLPLVVGILEPLIGAMEYITDALADLQGNLEKFWIAFPEVTAFFDGMKKAIKGFFDWLAEGLVWMYDKVMHFWSGSGIHEDVLLPAMEFITKTIPETLKKAGKWISDKLTAAYDFVAAWWQKIMYALGIDKASDAAKGIIQALISSLQAPYEALKKFLNYYVIGTVNDILASGIDIPGLESFTLGAAVGYGNIPQLAHGGIATDATLAEIGEGGSAEAVVPLNKQGLKQFMEPALGDMSIAGIDEQSGLLGELVQLGREALAMMRQRAEEQAEARDHAANQGHNVEADLSGGIGLGGIIPVGW